MDSSDRKVNEVKVTVEENKDLEQVKENRECALVREGEFEVIKEKLRLIELQPIAVEDEKNQKKNNKGGSQ